jgi:hypothetical protein
VRFLLTTSPPHHLTTSLLSSGSGSGKAIIIPRYSDWICRELAGLHTSRQQWHLQQKTAGFPAVIKKTN